ncbi:unnamed protein product [Lactuca saligna]|uniref:TF-B3 domain-containing protein n=1 Tax=Lactuca saligna TaxID=75948 RepID=A0AA35ZC26_LACSI|nr:unnamed protein product [Lactuca saligna]
MSLDLFSSTLPESLMETQNNPIFYTHHPQLPSSALGDINFNPHNDRHELEQVFINTDITTTIAKEHMFQKTLTLSDVGKLNRLVIPKHHAEKYFPFGGGGDATNQRKGLVLSFEDESGKLWRFQYSYWKSSQSYVLTKGWNGMVAAVAQPVNGGAQINQWSNMAVLHHAQSHYPSHHPPISIPLRYQPDCLHAGMIATRRLRLFGVNLECSNNYEPQSPDNSSHGGQ